MPHKYTIEFDEDTWRDLVEHAGRGNIKDYITHLLEREFRAARTRAVILCGGEAAELYPTRIPIPKAMLPVNYRPVVEYLIQHLAYHGISRITMIAGAKGNVREHFDHLRFPGAEIDVITEPRPNGTAGALRGVKNQVRGPFLVLHGDILTNCDLSSLLSVHRQRGAKATVLLAGHEQAKDHDVRRLGKVRIDDDGKVVELAPPVGVPEGAAAIQDDGPPVDPGAYYNAGAYVFEPEILDLIPAEGPAGLEDDLLPGLVAHGQVQGFVMHESDYWTDVADPRGFSRAWEDLLTGRFALQ